MQREYKAEGVEAGQGALRVELFDLQPRFWYIQLGLHAGELGRERPRVLVEQKKLRQPMPRTQGIELKFIERAQKEAPHLFSDLKPVR